jgi:hypothetical protein
MPSFHIHIVNSDFAASDELDASSFDDARSQALKATLQIGTDEMCKGIPFFGAEVRIEANGELRQRFLVSMGQSPLNNYEPLQVGGP